MCLNDDATFTSAENALTGVSPTRDVRGTNLDLAFGRSLSLNAQAAWASPSLFVPMDTYADADPYARPRFDNGIDSKIVIMGNSGVGKTSLLQRYTQNRFDPKNTTSTSGAFFVTKKILVNGLKVRLQLWDTAGQERFRSMVGIHPTSPFFLSLLSFLIVTIL